MTTQVADDSAASSDDAPEAMEQRSVPVDGSSDESPGPPPPVAPPVRRVVLGSVIVGVLAMLAASLLLRLWSAPLAVPFDYDGDAAFYLMEIQGLHDHGSYLTNPNLGYPFGQDTRDLPQGADNLNWLALRLLSVFGGPGTTMNLFYLLSFGVIAGMAFAVLRLLRIRPLIAAVASLLYAFLPYHLLRRGGHLLLVSYGFIPLAVLFALVDPVG